MSTDTRPWVTVVGTVRVVGGWFWDVDIDSLPDDPEDHPFEDGDEVEITIRKHERATGNLFPAPEEADE